MLRVSHFLRLARLNIELHATTGQPIPVEAIPSITSLMAHLERECAVMENQIAGTVVVPDLSHPSHTNIVSLAAFYEKRQSKTPPKSNEPA